MATFDAYPAAAQQPTVSPMDIVGKAAQINQTLLQNTGMGLQQHYQRMGTVARGAMALFDPQTGTADPAAVKAFILDQSKMKNIQPNEAATLYTSVPTDPRQAGTWLREQVAGVNNALDAITPHFQSQDVGSGAVVNQTSPYAAGGASMWAGNYGMNPSAAAQGRDIVNPDGSRTQTTVGAYAAAHGQPMMASGGNALTGGAPTGNALALPQIARPAPPPPNGQISTNALAPSPAQLGQQTRNALGMPSQPAAAPTQPASSGFAVAPSPQAQAVMTAQATKGNDEYTNFVSQATDPSVQQRLSSLDDILSTVKAAQTGTGAEQLSWLRGVISQVPGVDVSGALTAKQMMDKASAMLANSTLISGGPQTNQALIAAMQQNPHSVLTKDGIQATAAMVKGVIEYNQNLGLALQQHFGDSKPTINDVNAFKKQYAETAPTAFVLSLGDLPPSRRPDVAKFISGLPTAQRNAVYAQIAKVYGQK